MLVAIRTTLTRMDMRIHMVIDMSTAISNITMNMINPNKVSAPAHAHLRLLQFLSPAMPVGAYSYSQGLEWAVNQKWITDKTTFQQWVTEQISSTLAQQELPLLRRLYQANKTRNEASADHWTQVALAVRDTAELRQEELDRAEAYLRVLTTVTSIDKAWSTAPFLRTPLMSMAWFSVINGIEEEALILAFAHNWLENSLISGVKIIPLGQSAAQEMLYQLAENLSAAAHHSLSFEDDCIGVSLPALTMASCKHEVQYSRIYRS